MLDEDPRTFERPTPEEMMEVVSLAFEELDRFLHVAGDPRGKYSRYAGRLIAICLVQGAAQHLVDTDGTADAFDNEERVRWTEIEAKGFDVLPDGRVVSGIKDVDVVFFFREDDLLPLPANRHLRKSVVTTFPTLGRRRLDFMKKGVPEEMLSLLADDHPRTVVRAYLRRSRHGREYLSTKSVVGLHPEGTFGVPLWRTRRVSEA